MYKPTDEEIDCLCAEACGWKLIPFPGTSVKVWAKGNDWETQWNSRKSHAAAYTTDRNALPELWEIISRKKMTWLYGTFLRELVSRDHLSLPSFCLITAPPRLHCIAALKALGRWPDDWSNEP